MTAPAPPPPKNEPITRAQVFAELRRRAHADVTEFVERHVQIHDETRGLWVPFKQWEAQRWLTALWKTYRQLVGLKARQLGITWDFLAKFLHAALSQPHTTWLMFSRREDDAFKLLERVRGMHERLPPYLQGEAAGGNKSEMRLTNGAKLLAFPSGVGDSYTATGVLLDEFDLLSEREQEDQLRAVKPTTDGGGKLVVISRPDKSKPNSPFKRLYRAARRDGDKIGWKAFFLSWYARPDRDAAWYARIKADCLARTGSLDELHEQYAATEQEALAERQLDKRLPGPWLDACFRELAEEHVTSPLEALTLPGQWLSGGGGLTVYRKPDPRREYRVAGDPAEGLPNSDDSAAEVLDAETLEEVATLAGKFPPAAFGRMLKDLSEWYNGAPVLVERNNHGHAVLLWLATHAAEVPLVPGRDRKPGWQTNPVSKSLLYDDAAEVLRETACVLHDLETRLQLGSIEQATLKAPTGRADDRATAWVLAVQAAKAPVAFDPRNLILLGPRGGGELAPATDDWDDED